MRYNQELYQLYRTPDIIREIRVARLRWAGHVQRMDRSEMPKSIKDCKPEGRRAMGRPKLRWMDGVVEDLRKMGVKSWWTVARDRESWKKVLQEAEVRSRL
jgi:hypothetical protein